MLELLRAGALLAALVAGALQAGVYYGFACGVMPGLHHGDDRTFVAAMRQINIAIVNPWFLVTFLGAPLLAAVAAGFAIGGGRGVLVWAVLGFAGALATFVITAALNMPLNNALAAAGEPDHIADLGAVRAGFETAWVSWNAARAVTSTLGVACLAWALVLAGRAG